MFDATFGWALLAAFGVALCNGVAAVLQKSGADSAPKARSLAFGLLIRLARNWPYVLGTALDVIAGGLIVFAVHTLPLFLAESIVASSVAITFVIERFLLHRYSARRAYLAIGMVIVGLILLAFTAVPETAAHISTVTIWGIGLALVPLAGAAAWCSRQQGHWTANALAVISGIGFGGTAIVGRIIPFPDPFWHILGQPLTYVFAAYGLVAIMAFTIGLQRATATALATTMVITETVVPAIVGVVLLGDHVRAGLWPLAIVGIIAATCGAALLSSIRQHHVTE